MRLGRGLRTVAWRRLLNSMVSDRQDVALYVHSAKYYATACLSDTIE